MQTEQAPTPRSPRDLDSWLQALPSRDVVARSNRRQLIALGEPHGPGRLAKIFEKTPRSRRPLGWLQRRAGYSPADREWRGLNALHAAGLPVPRPLERGFAGGRAVILMEQIPGRRLAEALPRDRHARRAVLRDLGRTVGQLHARGFVHGDLHLGNCLMGPEGQLTLLDFQRSRRTRSKRARLRDLADLDFSLERHGVSIFERVRLRRAALADNPVDGTRDTIRAIGRAARDRAARHYRSRTRRALRPGRLYESANLGDLRGLRVRDFASHELRAAVEGHRRNILQGRDGVLKSDARARVTAVDTGRHRVVIKEVTKRGIGRKLADVVRGSPGRRAWVAGHGLLCRGIGAARPLAFLEARRLGRTRTSLVVLEDVRPRCPAHEVETERGPWLSEILLRLVSELHRRGVIHGDFQAPHVFVDTRPGSRANPQLIDLEGVRFRRRLSDHDRIQALAELNASLPDGLIGDHQRREAFALYARRLPFSGSGHGPRKDERALEEVVRRSLARQHFWKGSCKDGPETLPLSPPSP